MQTRKTDTEHPRIIDINNIEDVAFACSKLGIGKELLADSIVEVGTHFDMLAKHVESEKIGWLMAMFEMYLASKSTSERSVDGLRRYIHDELGKSTAFTSMNEQWIDILVKNEGIFL